MSVQCAALPQTLGSQTPSMCLDDYQRRLVDKIKRGLDSSKRQWENRLQQKVDLYNKKVSPNCSPKASRKDYEAEATNTPMSLDYCGQHGEINTADVVVSCKRHDCEPRLRILKCDCESQLGGKSRWSITVDINEFLPGGEVVVSRDMDSLVISGQNTTSSHRHRSSRSSLSPREVKVTERVSFKDSVEIGDLTATTSRDGVMTISLVTRNGSSIS